MTTSFSRVLRRVFGFSGEDGLGFFLGHLAVAIGVEAFKELGAGFGGVQLLEHGGVFFVKGFLRGA